MGPINSVKDDSLRFRPASAVGPELLAKLREHKADIIRLLNGEAESTEGRQADPQPAGCKLSDELVADLMTWPDPPTDAERQARGRETQRCIALARELRELADAAEAWDRMRAKLKRV